MNARAPAFAHYSDRGLKPLLGDKNKGTEELLTPHGSTMGVKVGTESTESSEREGTVNGSYKSISNE